MNPKKNMGEEFSIEIINALWEKAETINGRDANVYRKDQCGALIKRDLYYKDTIPLSMAWQVNYIKPEEKGGKKKLQNLQALQWENNLNKKDNEYFWACKVTSCVIQNCYVK